MENLNELIKRAFDNAESTYTDFNYLKKDIFRKTLKVGKERDDKTLSLEEFQILEKLGFAKCTRYKISDYNSDYNKKKKRYVYNYDLKYSKRELLWVFNVNFDTEDFSRGLTGVMENHIKEKEDFIKKISIDEETRNILITEILKNNFILYDGIFEFNSNGNFKTLCEIVIGIEGLGEFIFRNKGIVIPIKKYKEFTCRIMNVFSYREILDCIGIYSGRPVDTRLNPDTKKFVGNSKFKSKILNSFLYGKEGINNRINKQDENIELVEKNTNKVLCKRCNKFY